MVLKAPTACILLLGLPAAFPVLVDDLRRAGKPFKVAMLLSDNISDLTWNHGHNLGRIGALSTIRRNYPWLAVESNYYIHPDRIGGEINPAVVARIDELARSGVHLIFGASFFYQDPMLEAAAKYPATSFVHIAGFKSGTPNFMTAWCRIYQARYLSGITAGGTSASGNIGYIAAIPTSQVFRGINAFAIGVRAQRPDATVYLVWTGAWTDPPRSRWAARWLVMYGCDVVGGHTNDIDAFRTAIQEGAYACGYHADLRTLYGDSVLSSAYFQWSGLYTRLAMETLTGRFGENGLSAFDGFSTSVPAISSISHFVPTVAATRMERDAGLLKAGSDWIFCGPLYDNEGKLLAARGSCLTDPDLLGMRFLVSGLLELQGRDTVVLPEEICDVGTWYTFFPKTGTFACVQCAAGTYADAPGMESCLPCGQGRFSAVGAQNCTLCPPGTFSKGAAPECLTCPNETVTSSPGSAECFPCAEGEVADPAHLRCLHQSENEVPVVLITVCTIGGVMLLVSPLLYKYAKNLHRVRRLRSDAHVAEQAAEAIARMDFDSVQWILELDKPNAICRSFQAIIGILVHYKPYLPQALLATLLNPEDQAQEEDDVEAHSTDDDAAGVDEPGGETTTPRDDQADSCSLKSSGSGATRSAFSAHSGKRSSRVPTPSPNAPSRFSIRGNPLLHTPSPLRVVGPASWDGEDLGTKHMSTVVLARLSTCPEDNLNAVAGFASAILSSVDRDGGVIISVTTAASDLRILAGWNTHRRCATHTLTACSSALSSSVDVERNIFRGGERQWNLSCATGVTCVGTVGNDRVRTVVLVGQPLVNCHGMSDLAVQLRVRTACNATLYSRVRSEITARPVDVAQAPLLGEFVVYELLSSGSRDYASKEYIAAFSNMRQGRFSEALASFAVHLADNATDYQALRLLHLAAARAEDDSGNDEPLVRHQQVQWEDLELAASSVELPAHLHQFNASLERAREAAFAGGKDSVPSTSPADEGALIKQKLEAIIAEYGAEDEDDGTTATAPLEADPSERADLETPQLGNTITSCSRRSGNPNAKAGKPAGRIPSTLRDAKGRVYHRSSTRLGKGAFGEVWLGMGTGGEMVAVKCVSVTGDFEGSTSQAPQRTLASAADGGGGDWTIGGDSDEDEEPPPRVETTAESEGTGRRTVDKGKSKKQMQSIIIDMVHEIALMTSLKHENVVQYLGAAVEGAYCLIIMEYLPGGCLSAIMTQFGGSIPLTCARRFIGDIVRGIAFIHSHNIVHRDLKPANVLLTVEGQARIADFGASAELGAATTWGDPNEGRLARVTGTPLYMAPEQARGSAEAKSDVWAIGIVTCELLTGRVPWGDPGIIVAFLVRLADRPNCVPEIPDSIPAEAKELAAACLKRDPSERPEAKDLLMYAFLI